MTSSASIAERLSGQLGDRYRIERELGSGGMATVYLAEDVRHHRKVAIKVLHPELSAVLGSERFLKEIELTANLQHPHILPLFDSGSADGLLYYVMPYVEGETLRGRIERESQLSISDAVRIATEVADALEYAHKRRNPSRHQAREHPPARRPPTRRRFRDRARAPAGRRRADDEDRHVARHAAVHGSRAGDGRQDSGSSRRHLCTWRRDIRDDRRGATVHRAELASDLRQGDHIRPGAAGREEALCSSTRGCRGADGARENSGGQICERGRVRQCPGESNRRSPAPHTSNGYGSVRGDARRSRAYFHGRSERSLSAEQSDGPHIVSRHRRPRRR